MSRMIRSAVVTVAVTLVLVASPSQAALEITTRDSPPSGPEVLLASPVPAGAGAYLMTHGTGVRVGVGQTFRFSTPVELDKVTLLVRPLTAQVPGEGVTLQLTTFDGLADVTPDQPVTAAAAALPTSLEVGETTYLVLDLDDLTLEAGRQYGFVLEFGGGGNVNDARVEILHTAADSYGGGRPFLKEFGNDGAVYTPEDLDLVFYLEGTAEDDSGACEPVPEEHALTTPEYPDFRFWVRFSVPDRAPWWGEVEPVCLPEALCASGALPGRTEALLRIVGPKPNGYLWPTLVKLSTSQLEIWVEQRSTGAMRCYVLEGAEPGSDALEGLFDRTGFLP